MRILRQNVGEPRRDTEDQADKADQFRILPQQREKPPAGAQPREKPVEGRKRAVRIFAARELVDDDRHQIGEIGARLFAAQRPISARTPAAHGVGNLERLAEAHMR